MKTSHVILIAVIALIGGWLLGKRSCSIQTEQTIAYEQLPPIISIVEKPTIVKEYIIDAPKWLIIERIDTVTKEVKQVVDTQAILQDWATKRLYAGELFNDSTGHAEYSAEVQYNQLQLLKHAYTPIQRTVTNTVYKQDNVVPFIMVGADSRQFMRFQGGVFLKDYSIALDVGWGMNGGFYYGAMVGIKF